MVFKAKQIVVPADERICVGLQQGNFGVNDTGFPPQGCAICSLSYARQLAKLGQLQAGEKPKTTPRLQRARRMPLIWPQKPLPSPKTKVHQP